jgi:hypothetical protein
MTTWKVRRFVHIFCDEYDLDRMQSRLAVSRNANDVLEVDDSLLNTGLIYVSHPASGRLSCLDETFIYQTITLFEPWHGDERPSNNSLD